MGNNHSSFLVFLMKPKNWWLPFAGVTFQTFTWMRILGGAIFLFGGLVPLVWFIVSRAAALRSKEIFKPLVTRHEPVLASEAMDID